METQQYNKGPMINSNNELENFEKIINISSLQGRCNLCLDEKSLIKYKDTINLLNKREEFIAKCRHKNKYQIWYQIILYSNHV